MMRDMIYGVMCGVVRGVVYGLIYCVMRGVVSDVMCVCDLW